MLKGHAASFYAVYLVCGISDVLDGYIARRYHWESSAGAKLDSLSDFVFYAIVLYLMFFTTDIAGQPWVIIGFALVFAIRLANLLITRIKFAQWGMLHSLANKAAGLALFLVMPFALTAGSLSWLPGGVLFVIAALSAIEETMILLSTNTYDVNRKSYFI